MPINIISKTLFFHAFTSQNHSVSVSRLGLACLVLVSWFWFCYCMLFDSVHYVLVFVICCMDEHTLWGKNSQKLIGSAVWHSKHSANFKNAFIHRCHRSRAFFVVLCVWFETGLWGFSFLFNSFTFSFVCYFRVRSDATSLIAICEHWPAMLWLDQKQEWNPFVSHLDRNLRISYFHDLRSRFMRLHL